MSRSLRTLLAVTDWGFILYWSVTALAAAHVIALPASWLFKDYADPRVVAWNWSFLPLDLAASGAGLAALRTYGRGRPMPGLLILALALTSCAGLMAIAYWTALCEVSLAWWAPNVFLLAWPWLFLPGLLRGSAEAPALATQGDAH